MKIGLIITGAGSGTRFKQKKNKLLSKVNNKTILEHTLSNFKGINEITNIIITVSEEDKDIFQSILENNGLKNVSLILGGKTRFESVKNGFQALNPCDMVWIHDGARPIVPKKLIDRLLRSSHYNAAIPVIPITDTVKEVQNNIVKKTVNRDILYRVQTPQLFKYTLLNKAYETIHDPSVTDEAMLIEKLGEIIHTFQGSSLNIKLTTPDDLPFIESIIRS